LIQKRLFDLIVAVLGLIVLLPLLLGISVLVKASSHGPVFFSQRRVGLNGKPFLILKFRSMVTDGGTVGSLVTGDRDPRVTKFGSVLRRYKLDELPQLLNVIRGEMSLVGPRPEVPKFVKLFQEDYDLIHKVKPGITDYAALCFRNESELLESVDDPEEYYVSSILPLKIGYYFRYIDEQSFWLDVKLFLLTVISVFYRGLRVKL
jgi:lipopolysaccharide/colanic/teichoic acid biosynthesis glycosyltransferase